jgi:hypothetical protein
MGILSRKPRTPSYTEQLLDGTESEVIASAAMPTGQEDMLEQLSQDQFFVDDDKILALFDPNQTQFFKAWLVPIHPLVSRLISLTNISSRQAERLWAKCKLELLRLKYSRKSNKEKMLVRALMIYIEAKLNDAVNGWKFNRMTEKRRRISIERPATNKKRWWSK